VAADLVRGDTPGPADGRRIDSRTRRASGRWRAAQLPPRVPELQLLHRWLDPWTGIGLIAVGLLRQGWDLQLTQYGDGNWRATFYVTGVAHSIVGASAWEATAWGAVQTAAWATVSTNSTR
jgi:hypothetical protein